VIKYWLFEISELSVGKKRLEKLIVIKNLGFVQFWSSLFSNWSLVMIKIKFSKN
jgi:hypothetical protein